MVNARGFTIVEVIVALLVLAVGLLSTVSTFAATSRNFESGHSSVVTSARAGELLEIARARGCGGIADGAKNDGIGVYLWSSEEISTDLQLITVVFSPWASRSRADTFSVVLPC